MTDNAGSTVLCEDLGNGIVHLELNRPDRLNALNSGTLSELLGLLRVLRTERARVVVITGRGRAFCAGADIAELSDHADPQSFSDYLADMLTTFDALASYPFLTIAGVHGVALGGGFELALACDLRVLAQNASVGLLEIALGALPGGGGLARLTHMLPSTLAREMVLLGRRISAGECLAHGLATSVCDSDQMLPTCLELAAQVRPNSREAIALGKTLLTAIDDERSRVQSTFARAAICQLVRAAEFRDAVNEFQAPRSKDTGNT